MVGGTGYSTVLSDVTWSSSRGNLTSAFGLIIRQVLMNLSFIVIFFSGMTSMILNDLSL